MVFYNNLTCAGILLKPEDFSLLKLNVLNDIWFTLYWEHLSFYKNSGITS